MDIINPIDREAYRQLVLKAHPFPYFCIDHFLNEEFALAVADAFPSFDEAKKMGRSFSAVNEQGKVQVTDARQFAQPIARLNEALASKPFLDTLSYIFQIPDLLPDDQLVGGGMQQTGPRGFLDVHVDFNFIPERKLYRRLNILIYFNKQWKKEWGGNIELWDKNVQHCEQSFLPIFNRCVIFATNDISYHGVTAVTCPADMTRKSFAAYYYTKEAPVDWKGVSHSTVFKARPQEKLKKNVLMPIESGLRGIHAFWDGFKKTIKKHIGKS